MVKNSPCNAGGEGSIPGLGTKIPHAAGQLSTCGTTRVSCAKMKRLHAAIKTQCGQINT